MKLRELIPPGAKDYFRLLRAKIRFRDSLIGSPAVSVQARIGIGCRVGGSVLVNHNVTIGNYTYVNSFTMIGSGEIGNYCSLGYYCSIGMHQHPLHFLSTSPMTYHSSGVLGVQSDWNDFFAPPKIGHDVWIGNAAQIMQGVCVGSGAVIGAGAIVTEDIPPYSIAVGVPARVLRKRFDDETIQYLLNWNWWDLEPEELKKFGGHFGKADWSDACIGRLKL
jgi:acetyltransferase-like isoleucine patch superfamily enzyme